MYSYTVTGIHRIHPVEPNQPQLRIVCKCKRSLIQQQIYTCLSCTNYCCHYCTIPDVIFFQCRNCNAVSQSNKTNKCKMCFSCPYCSNVLSLTRANDKKLMMWCQYCYWTTKEIDIVADKNQELFQALNRTSASLKGQEEKIYNATQTLFKEIATVIDYENQVRRSGSGSRRSFSRTQEESLLDTKKQIEKTCEMAIKRTGLQEASEQYDGEYKIPQNLTLQAKKTRRCPTCKKPLTTSFRSTRTGQQKTQLVYKQLKVLQCQIKPAVSGQVKIKCLRACTLDNSECKEQDIREVPVNSVFKVKVQLANRGVDTSLAVQYDFIVLL